MLCVKPFAGVFVAGNAAGDVPSAVRGLLLPQARPLPDGGAAQPTQPRTAEPRGLAHRAAL